MLRYFRVLGKGYTAVGYKQSRFYLGLLRGKEILSRAVMLSCTLCRVGVPPTKDDFNSPGLFLYTIYSRLLVRAKGQIPITTGTGNPVPMHNLLDALNTQYSNTAGIRVQIISVWTS